MNSITSQKSHNFEIKNRLNEITVYYTQELEQAYEFLRDSKDYLEFKKIKNNISAETYLIRMRTLMNMALVYIYSVYEAFTRAFFAEVVHHDLGLNRDQFNAHYHRFHDLNKRLMQERYHIRLPHRMYIVIKQLRNARNDIVHLGKKAEPVFENVEYCLSTTVEYFRFIENEIFFKIQLIRP